jgi:phosphonate degradation associated HDIG domain protein
MLPATREATMIDEFDRLIGVLDRADARAYGGEALSQCAHALQCARLAEEEGAKPTLVAASLLHDIGHLLHELGPSPARRGIDDRHEDIGGAHLLPLFGPAVAEPVRLHVEAKRYLCATDPAYFSLLSPGSVRSLALQGGPLDAEQASRFRQIPYALDAVRVRRWDEAAKVAGLATPSLDHFRATLGAALTGR